MGTYPLMEARADVDLRIASTKMATYEAIFTLAQDENAKDVFVFGYVMEGKNGTYAKKVDGSTVVELPNIGDRLVLFQAWEHFFDTQLQSKPRPDEIVALKEYLKTIEDSAVIADKAVGIEGMRRR